MKSFILLIITLLATAVFPAYVITANTLMVGDVNEDGYINIHDCIKIAQHLAKIPGMELSVQENINADVNGDSNVDIMDLVILLQYVTNTDRYGFSKPDVTYAELCEESASTESVKAGFASEPDIPVNAIEAGEAYLTAVAAAGNAYDAAATYAREIFETAIAGMQWGSKDYNELLNIYREAVNIARKTYDSMLDAALAAYEAATSR